VLIEEDRAELADGHTSVTGAIDKLGATALAEYDDTLAVINAAIFIAQ
jgi:hypothetical protein